MYETPVKFIQHRCNKRLSFEVDSEGGKYYTYKSTGWVMGIVSTSSTIDIVDYYNRCCSVLKMPKTNSSPLESHLFILLFWSEGKSEDALKTAIFLN